MPAGDAEPLVEFEQQARHRAGDKGGGGDADQKPRIDAGAVFRGKPKREVEGGAGKEAGLGGAQQETQAVEAVRADREQGGHRDQPPADHDPRQPAPRAELVQCDVAGHLEQAVAGGQDADAEAELRRRQPHVLDHGEAGEADIVAVDEIDDVGEAEQRQDAPGDLGEHHLFPRAQVGE